MTLVNPLRILWDGGNKNCSVCGLSSDPWEEENLSGYARREPMKPTLVMPTCRTGAVATFKVLIIVVLHDHILSDVVVIVRTA